MGKKKEKVRRETRGIFHAVIRFLSPGKFSILEIGLIFIYRRSY